MTSVLAWGSSSFCQSFSAYKPVPGTTHQLGLPYYLGTSRATGFRPSNLRLILPAKVYSCSEAVTRSMQITFMFLQKSMPNNKPSSESSVQVEDNCKTTSTPYSIDLVELAARISPVIRSPLTPPLYIREQSHFQILQVHMWYPTYVVVRIFLILVPPSQQRAQQPSRLRRGPPFVGVYFRQQNSDDSKSLIDSFYASVDYALNLCLASSAFRG